MLREPFTIETTDNLLLEGELVSPDHPIAAAVLAHPNSRDGGNMRSMVPGELIKALPDVGVATLRFNFRGVGASQGEMEDGVGERLDLVAALTTMAEITEGLPLIVCGSSFGANVSLTVDHPAVNAWCACAPTLPDAMLRDMAAVGHDVRPKHLVIAERDNYRAPESVNEVVRDWQNTSVDVIKGADHFFVGRIELVVAAVQKFVLAQVT